MNYEDLDVYSLSLHNLKLLKLLYDSGIDISKYPHFYSNPYSGGDESWTIFLDALSDLFFLSEYFLPYDGQEEDKEYWLKQAGVTLEENDLELTGVIVILDDRFKRNLSSLDIACGRGADWYFGFAEFLPIENGIVIQYNEEDGMLDLVVVLKTLIDTLGGDK